MDESWWRTCTIQQPTEARLPKSWDRLTCLQYIRILCLRVLVESPPVRSTVSMAGSLFTKQGFRRISRRSVSPASRDGRGQSRRPTHAPANPPARCPACRPSRRPPTARHPHAPHAHATCDGHARSPGERLKQTLNLARMGRCRDPRSARQPTAPTTRMRRIRAPHLRTPINQELESLTIVLRVYHKRHNAGDPADLVETSRTDFVANIARRFGWSNSRPAKHDRLS